MSGYIIPRNNLLEAGTIEPSNNNVISRAAIAGGKAMFYIPIYDDISMGDTVSGYISTDGDWHLRWRTRLLLWLRDSKWKCLT